MQYNLQIRDNIAQKMTCGGEWANSISFTRWSGVYVMTATDLGFAQLIFSRA